MFLVSNEKYGTSISENVALHPFAAKNIQQSETTKLFLGQALNSMAWFFEFIKSLEEV